MGVENRVTKLIFGIFGIIGIIFIIVTICVGVIFHGKKERMVLNEAVITQIITEKHSDDTSHYVYVDYEYEDRLYEHRYLGYYASSMYEGKYIEIYVDPQDPNEIMGKYSAIILLVVFGTMGGVFTFIGSIGVGYAIAKKRMYKRLFREGRRIYGTIEQIEKDINVSVNRRHPYFAQVAVRDDYTGETKYYRSDDFWDDVAENINIGDTAVIYVDQDDNRKYFVDITGANSVMGSSMAELY